MPISFAELTDRGVLAITGADRLSFLSNLVSNNLEPPASYAALLTPQGKYLFDFFVLPQPDALWLEVEAARLPELQDRLTRYRLRADVQFADLTSSLAVLAFLPGPPVCLNGNSFSFADPRLPQLGSRAIVKHAELPSLLAQLQSEGAARFDYNHHRITLGIAEGPDDLQPEQSYILECNFEALHGVSFAKGCYVGQETTARMHHRQLVKKKILPVTLTHPAQSGTNIISDAVVVGKLGSVSGLQALALLQLQAARRPLLVEGTPVTVNWPAWLQHD